jgi:glycosyltransferase involved in cell wall biosynthesis
VFASSTPLTIGIPAFIHSKIYKRPFVFEVRDLWPEAPIQLGVLKNKILIQLSTWLELFFYRKASLLIGLSRGICKKIQARSGKPCHFIPNSVDDEFFERRNSRIKDKNKALVKVIYAGSCGYNNAIEVLFMVAKKAADPLLSGLIQFQLVGDGPALEQLKNDVPRNLSLLGKRSKSDTIDLLMNADIAFFSQRKLEKGDLKKDSLGNKFFDFLGAALPIVAGVVKEGEMAIDIEKYACGIVVEPEDVSSMCHAIKKLANSKALRLQMSNAASELSKKYAGSKIAERFVSVLEKTTSYRCPEQKPRPTKPSLC